MSNTDFHNDQDPVQKRFWFWMDRKPAAQYLSPSITDPYLMEQREFSDFACQCLCFKVISIQVWLEASAAVRRSDLLRVQEILNRSEQEWDPPSSSTSLEETLRLQLKRKHDPLTPRRTVALNTCRQCSGHNVPTGALYIPESDQIREQ